MSISFFPVKSYTGESSSSVAISLSPGINQELVAAPGPGKQIWVYGYHFGSTVAGTVSFQDSDDTALTGVMPVTAGIALATSSSDAFPLFKVATDKALEADVVTCSIAGVLQYKIVSV